MCVSADTRIATKLGQLRVVDIVKRNIPIIYPTLPFEDRNITLLADTTPIKETSPSANIYRVTTNKGYFLDCTLDHILYSDLVHSKAINQIRKPLSELNIGSNLIINTAIGGCGDYGDKKDARFLARAQMLKEGVPSNNRGVPFNGVNMKEVTKQAVQLGIIPKDIYSANIPTIREYFRFLFSEERDYSFHSSNLNLLRQIQILCTSLGVNTNIINNKEARPDDNINFDYTIRVTARNYRLMRAIVHAYNKGEPLPIGRNLAYYTEITNIEFLRVGAVYSLTHHVKNCVIYNGLISGT